MPEVTLDIPKDLYRQAQRIAQKRQQAIQDVLLESIMLEDEGAGWGQPSDEEAAWREERAFQELHPQLLQRYPGEFVAILDGEVVDHDTDQVMLYKRVRKHCPGRFVLIAEVKREPVEEYTFRSPRFTATP